MSEDQKDYKAFIMLFYNLSHIHQRFVIVEVASLKIILTGHLATLSVIACI